LASRVAKLFPRIVLMAAAGGEGKPDVENLMEALE
jgi:hypothetical protein